MFPNCSHSFTGFRTHFVFSLAQLLPMLVIFFGFNGNFNGKMTKINKLAKNHLSGVQNGYVGVLEGVFVLKSGLRILIRAPQVPFIGTPKIAKNTQNGRFGGYRKWHLGCPNQNSETTSIDQNHPQKDTFGTQIGPRKVIFGHFLILVIFPLKFPLK